MYCTTSIELQADGDFDEARAVLQAAIDDIAELLRDHHIGITSPGIEEPLHRDDVDELPDCEADFDDSAVGLDG